MNPSEAWSLLTVRSKEFDRCPSGHGSLSSSDVAALLAGLEREPFLMGMAAECGDLRSLQEVELVLWVRSNTIADREDWDPPRGEFTVRRLVGVALYESIGDFRCYHCVGSGEITFETYNQPGLMFAPSFKMLTQTKGRVDCPACDGASKVKLSGRKRAALAGINKDTWTRMWNRRYEPIHSMAHNWIEIARGHLAGKLRELREVDTEASRGASEAESHEEKNPKPLNGSCVVPLHCAKNHLRESASAKKAAPPEVDYAALQRPKLRLNQ